MYKCPVPNCPEPLLPNILTLNHCRTYHNMTKKEVEDTYGISQWIPITQNLLNKNLADFVAYGKINIHPMDNKKKPEKSFSSAI